jgi:hypothetical protein
MTMNDGVFEAVKQNYGRFLNELRLSNDVAATLCLAYETRLLREVIDSGVDQLSESLCDVELQEE